jgi:pantoate--beta-alanine ligase
MPTTCARGVFRKPRNRWAVEMTTLVNTIAGLRDHLHPMRGTGSIGLVPTMGALHAGHARLIEHARQECTCVVVSIFVNPTQFDREADLRGYPRTLQEDLDLCSRMGVDLVFAPSVEEMYPAPLRCTVEVSHIADRLCGEYRPGHFRGVATVVMKLFQIVQPDRAYFGEKDAQQLAVVRRLSADLNVPVTILAVPTVRELDGLALSSRNRNLAARERERSTALYRALREAERRIVAGERDAEAVKRAAVESLSSVEGLRTEYLEIVDPDEMQPIRRIDGPVRVMAAIWIGQTRLIDNLLCAPPLKKHLATSVRSA